MADKAQQQEAQVQEEVQEVSLLDQILTEGKMARDDYQKEQAKDMIGEFVNQVMSGELTLSVSEVFALSDIKKAVAAAGEPGRKGKVLLKA